MQSKNDLLMVITRLTDRPVYKSWKKNIVMREQWENSGADLAIAIHGSSIEIANNDTDLWLGRIKLFDRQQKTDGRLPPFLYDVLQWAMSMGYKYIGLLDDDAMYTDPVEMASDVTRGFELNYIVSSLEKTRLGTHKWPIAGSIGPIDAFRKYHRYEEEGWPIEFLNPLYRTPWAPLGSQIYRANALYELEVHGLLAWLPKLKFRADVFLAMCLITLGWGNYEMDLDFRHICSSGLNQKKHTEEFHRAHLLNIEHDYEIYRKVFGGTELSAPDNSVTRWSEIIYKMQQSETKHHKRKLAKLGVIV